MVVEVLADLLVEGGELLSLCWSEAWLMLLVDDLVESLMEEVGDALAAITRCGDVAGVVVGYLLMTSGMLGMIRPNLTCIISLMADRDEQGNTNFQKKCRDQLNKIGAWPLFAKIAVWVVLALFVFFLVTKGLSGDGVLGFMAYLGNGAEPIKITATALTMIGGIGAVGYLVIKYQERTAAQRAEQRENEQQQLARQAEQREQRAEQRAITRQQAGVLLDAIHLLGDDKASTRIAGVQALEQIGQSRPEIRQRIIDILCGYLRTDRDKDGAVESTILATLHEHLLPKGDFAPLFWANVDLDLRNSTITEPINFSGIVCRKFDLSEAHVESNTRPDFTEAVFTQTASFNKVTCRKGMDFKKAHFGECLAADSSECGALFSNTTLVQYDFSEAKLNHANFVTSNIDTCNFTNSDLPHPDFMGCKITGTKFYLTQLQNASFQSCEFSRVSFSGSTFQDKADFARCTVKTRLDFSSTTFGNTKARKKAEVIFDEANIYSSFINNMMDTNDVWSFRQAHFPKSDKDKGKIWFLNELFSSIVPDIFFNVVFFDLDEEDTSSTNKNGN